MADGPGLDADRFLAAVAARGSRLVIRRFEGETHIKVVARDPPKGRGDRPKAPAAP